MAAPPPLASAVQISSPILGGGLTLALRLELVRLAGQTGSSRHPTSNR